MTTLQPGFVAEYHIRPDNGERQFIRFLRINEFLDAWDYALADSPEEFSLVENAIDYVRCFVGVVHEDGAFLSEVR